MSDPIDHNDAETVAKRFRGHVLKPAEGVFLFHPRAMERLITDHLSSAFSDLSIPELDYYLMPTTAFLVGLETENPEALAVIEGLSLPSYVILLPMPPEQSLDQLGFIRLLRDYWARRFEADVARAWQTARDEHQDGERFGLPGLIRRVGPLALTEIRDILTRDGIIPSGISDALVCRGFIALITRLRYFSPGVRGFLFPAIRDWRALDLWLIESGLDLPDSLTGGRLPHLLERSRPDDRCGVPARRVLLPFGLSYGDSDPDFVRLSAAAALQAASSMTGEVSPATADAGRESPLEIRCLDLLQHASQVDGVRWRTPLRKLVANLLTTVLARSPTRSSRKQTPGRCPRGPLLELHLFLLGSEIQAAHGAALAGRHAAAMVQLRSARQRYRTLAGQESAIGDRVDRLLSERASAAETLLVDQLAATADSSQEQAETLRALVQRLGEDADRTDSVGQVARMLLDLLERVLVETRTTYYQIHLGRWLVSRGRHQLRQILPFQPQLKALRALELATSRLDQLGWSLAEIEHFEEPLRHLFTQLSNRLANQLRPHLSAALDQAGFTPRNHREEVAANKMREELLDVIRRRRHLKFTDVRDIVARNILRLPDPTLDELLKGDRLAHFDRAATTALPGVYQPGEIYIKGLQQLSAPLFGTPKGRLVMRHLLAPMGLAFLGLKTIDLLVGLIVASETQIHLAQLWVVLSITLLINAAAYTRAGRWIAKTLWRGTCWTVRLLLFDGLRRLLRWGPVARLLATALFRGLDRNLIQPLFIGILMVLPFIGLGSLFEGVDIEPGLSSLALAFALGALVRHTSAGRRMLDNIISSSRLALRRVNQRLVIGLIRELMHFFKEVVRRFQQGLHWIEELLSHQLGESRLQLAVKSLFAPLWTFTESVIQFYVTVLVEPQINPIKHFPLVTITHKLMLPFLPALTGLMLAVADPFFPRWVSIPFVTLTILLLPGLAGFLVWELKENWRIYAANHAGWQPTAQTAGVLAGVDRADLPDAPIERAVIGGHGETMRGMLRRGFHSGTLPKAFDRLRRVLREQIQDEIPYPQRLRDACRRVAEVDHALRVFCDRELGYALRRRCIDPLCGLVDVETGRPRLCSSSFELSLRLFGTTATGTEPVELHLTVYLDEPDLYLKVAVEGREDVLGDYCWRLIRSDLAVFAGRIGAKQLRQA